MHETATAYYSSNPIGIVAVVVIIVIRLIVMAARSGNSKPKSYTPPPPPPQNFNQQPFNSKQYNPPQQNANPNYRDTFTSPENFKAAGNNPQPTTAAYYCMYCGKKFQSTNALLMDTCFKHPNSEAGLQKHVLYRGIGKPNIGF